MREVSVKIHRYIYLALFSIAAALVFGGLLSIHAKAAEKTLILNDTFVDGYITAGGSNGDVHFYKTSIPSAGWLTITYQGWSVGDSYYQVLSEDQSISYEKHELYTSSDTNPKTNSVEIALEQGTYTIKVWSYGSHTGKYSIKGSFKSAGNNETEPNDYFSGAMKLNKDNVVTGFLSRDDKIDFYKINVPDNKTVDVTLISRVSDMYYSVWDSEFMKLKEKEVYTASESNPKTSTIELNLSPGTYYIKCNPYGSKTGRYQLKWSYTPTKMTAMSITGKNTVAVGKSIQLGTSVTPANTTDKSVTWSSSYTGVATVSSSGKVTGKRSGSVTIYAKAKDGSNVQARTTILVAPEKMTKPKVKAKGKKKVSIRWRKYDGVNYRYQIQYSKKKSFKKSKKWTLYSYQTAADKKLAKGTYYFRVRAVSNYSNTKLYGSWSPSVKAKVK
ncbi:MAG: Ig-like domain-containing protein [Eubacterium sp.]|nr:Ig-like domain-containing protein [Eubacterium sp.]